MQKRKNRKESLEKANRMKRADMGRRQHRDTRMMAAMLWGGRVVGL